MLPRQNPRAFLVLAVDEAVTTDILAAFTAPPNINLVRRPTYYEPRSLFLLSSSLYM